MDTNLRTPETLTADQLSQAQTTPHTNDLATLRALLHVDPALGLTSSEATTRLDLHGANKLEETAKRARWLIFLDQFRDYLILILIAAAIVSYLTTREVKTPAFVGFVVILNAVLGYIQHGRAERSLDALKQMLSATVRVRRDNRVAEVESSEIVPGDIVLLEAGNRVPADGRLLLAASLEVEEAALTGESAPVEKVIEATVSADAGIGDRVNMLFSNTVVTRGRGEMLVVSTAMNTEIGRIAELLNNAETPKTPLQEQLDSLGKSLAWFSLGAVILFGLIGIARGEALEDLFLEAVALAVAAIPEGLPAVVAVTLAIGTAKMAKENAIVKKLASVETLGSVTTICSDKTGTLTMNQMTARDVFFHNRRFQVSGEGYSIVGSIHTEGENDSPDLRRLLVPISLCNDASVNADSVIGDPTEAALVVLAEKGGVNTEELRLERPRIAEVPFDSATKFMATFHHYETIDGDNIVRCYLKGAPDVLLARCNAASWEAGVVKDFHPEFQATVLQENLRYASQGMRVIGVARRDFSQNEFAALGTEPDVLTQHLHDLTFLGLVAIVDPPRPEATKAIAQCQHAGIDVKMITGDHLETAAAIGRELGLHGEAMTGAELATLSNDDLDARLDQTVVFARVAPEHKIRLVEALQRTGHVVSMTGDGVNDAPALKKADIGVAMGITGTEVTKEAATMVLADDNFATIVHAVRQGRTIYENLVKFIRFQMATNVGAILTLVGAQTFGWDKPLTAVQILWVNIIMDGPPAMALGVDPSEPDVMERGPRKSSDRLLGVARLIPLVGSGLVMAIGTLSVLQLAPRHLANTMAFTVFVLFQFWNALDSRSETRTIFARQTFTNSKLWLSLVFMLGLQILVTSVKVFQDFFNVVSLPAKNWGVCVAVSLSLVAVSEIRKVVVRATAIQT